MKKQPDYNHDLYDIFEPGEPGFHGYKIGERLRNIGAKETTWTVVQIFCPNRPESLGEIRIVNDQTNYKKYVETHTLDLYWVRVPEEAAPVKTWTPEAGWVVS
jgi:hypothetical protein